MTEHKYTDEEVIKALECCVAEGYPTCDECPFDGCCCDGTNKMLNNALALINRQKAEVAFWMDAAANAKKEAVKEFAEKLKKECLFDRGYEILQDGTIDHLVKEFTEEKT